MPITDDISLGVEPEEAQTRAPKVARSFRKVNDVNSSC